MDPDVSRLLIPRAEAKALLASQIMTGEALLEQTTATVVMVDLVPLRAEISAWMARNEAVLARSIGHASAQRYRLGTGAAVAVRGFGRRRAQLGHRVEAGLRKLRKVAAALDVVEGTSPTTKPSSDQQAVGKHNSAAIKETGPNSGQITLKTAPKGSTPQSKKAWWRAAMLSPWTVAICAPFIVAAILAGIHFASGKPAAGRALILTGTVVCDSGRPVVGVWIAASSGEADSGRANLGASGSTGRNHPGSEVTFSYMLRHGGTYSAHVGCGGTPSRWASANYSPLISGATVHLHCRDPVRRPKDGLVPTGSCT